MKALFILLAHSNTGAIIDFLAVLIIAALIGYFTAYFYYKSVYTKIINRLEAEKEDLNKKIDSLNIEIASLKNDVADLKNKEISLNAKITELNQSVAEKEKEIERLTKKVK